MKTPEIKLISASAGSGKTYRLMELVHEEVSNGLKASGLVAVTYTKKAAEELKQRIREKLIDTGKVDEARSMAAARVGTVHSVCADLLKRFSFEEGSSPRQKVIDEIESARLFESSLNEILTPEHLSLLGKLAFSFSTDLATLIANIRILAIVIRQNNLPKTTVQTLIEQSLSKIDLVLEKTKSGSTQAKLLTEITSYLKTFPQPPDTTKKTADAHKVVENANSQLSTGRQLPWAEWVRLTKLSPGVKSEEHFRGIVNCSKGFMSNADLRSDLRSMIELAYSLSALASERFALKKRNLGVLDYGDLEEKTLALLEMKSVCEQLSAELNVLFVDEFQDTNPIQLAIFLKLSAICKKTVWVGDLKQSIYRFRGADPELMKAVSQQLSKSSPEVLKDNWRSSPEIVSFVNALFVAGFSSDEIPANQIEQTSQWKSRTQDFALEVWDGNGKNKDERSQKLANGIRTLLSENIEILDRESSKHRALRPGDISVLCRSNDECIDLSLALSNLGVTTSVVGGSLLQLPEVTLALASYRYLTNSRDTIAAAEIALALGADRNQWLQSAINEVEPSSWHPALERLRSSQKMISEMSIREKLDLAIASVPVDSVVEKLSHGDSRVFHLSALRQEAKKYENSCHSAFQPCTDQGFLEFLDETKPPIPSANHSQAVSISTYHSSKGLEWPVVILASLNQAPRDASLFATRVEMMAGSKFDSNQPLANRIVTYLPWPFGNYGSIPELDAKSSQSKELAAIQESEESELRRLLYVGMTRGREKLILVNNLGKGGVEDSMLQVLSKEGKCVFSLAQDSNEVIAGNKRFPCKYRTLNTPVDGADSREDKSKSNTSLILPQGTPLSGDNPPLYLQPSHLKKDMAPELAREAKLGRNFNWGTKLLLKKLKSSDPKSENAPNRHDIIGSAVHLFLGSDQMTRSEQDRLANARSILECWKVSNSIDEADLLASSNRLFEAVGKLWPKSEIHREVPMELTVGNSILRGSIDYLVLSENEVAVIDHKTITATFDEFEKVSKEYQLQLSSYVSAVMAHFKAPKVSAWIHNPDGWLAEFLLEEKKGIHTQ